MGTNIRKSKALIGCLFLEWHRVDMTPLFIAYSTGNKDKILINFSLCIFFTLLLKKVRNWIFPGAIFGVIY